VAFLVDTNVLLFAFDHRSPAKRAVAEALLSEGISSNEARVAHQAVCEFVAAATRRGRSGEAALLTPHEARIEAELLLSQFVVLYPDEHILRLALRGWATYGFGWWDAHMWAHAEGNSLGLIYSEDFQHDRLYGKVRVVNPFI
jgi:predicted nucleic acid-binding protein